MMSRRVTLVGFAASILLLLVSTPALAQPRAEVIASGLANPRGIAFAPDGTLWVAEAGRGGDGACIPSSSGQVACYGETGALTRVDPAGVAGPARLVSGLPSIAPAGGFGATGPFDVSFLGTGGAYVVLGLGADPALRAGLGPKAELLGSVVKISAGGAWKKVADVAAHEAALNPDGAGVDTNPYGIAALPSARIVADAGGNTLVEAAVNGATRTLAVFPTRIVTLPSPPFPPDTKIPMQAVPTAVAEGPNGWLYVTQLTGFPFPTGGARIYRVPPEGGTPEIAAEGFTNAVDLAFDAKGDLFVLEIAQGRGTPPLPLQPPGKLWRIGTDGSRTLIYGGLFFPGGVAIGADGAAYVTNNGISPTEGQVLRIRFD